MGAQQSSDVKPNDEFEVLDIAPKKFENTFVCQEKSFDIPTKIKVDVDEDKLKQIIKYNEPIYKIPKEDISFDTQVSKIFIPDQFDAYHNKFVFNKTFKYRTFLNNYNPDSDSDDDLPDFKQYNKKKYDRNHYKKFYYRFKGSEFILNDILWHYKRPF